MPDKSGVEKPILSSGPVLGPAGGVITKLTVMDWFVLELLVVPVELVVVVVEVDELDALLIVIVPEQSGFTE